MKTKHLRSKTTYTAFIAASADGKISLKTKTPPDWTSPEDWQFLQKSLATFDAVVVGRNTYQAAATRLRKRNAFVLSSRIKNTQKRGSVTFINPASTDLMAVLSAYKKVAVLGGGAVYQFMLEHRMIDEVFITIEPIIFGRGKDMFSGGTKTNRLVLLSIKQLNKLGTLLIHYRVKK